MNPPKKVFPGEQYGRLTVLEQALGRTDKSGNRYYLCECACGNHTTVRGRNLRNGNTKSCGCLKAETAAQNSKVGARRGGASRHPLYGCWRAMLHRCDVPANPAYPRYGGRGITVCPKWREDPFAFYAHMGPRPAGHSLDRIDNDGNYEPGNVRWATRTEQQYNRANVGRGTPIPIDLIRDRFAAGTVSQAALAAEYGVHQSTISRAIHGRV